MARTKIAPLLTIVGETASGKSSLALRAAQRFNGEIICADAYTLRCGVNIGTAKPSEYDQSLIPHHLLNIIEPSDSFNASRFKSLANQAILDISSRGKLPIMVGGSGLYIDSVLFDYSFLKSDKSQRDKLNRLTQPQLIEKINNLGIDAETVDQKNKRRLIRLIETAGEQPSKHPLRPNTLVTGLSLSREKLTVRLEHRLSQMLAMGLENEVKGLSQDYGWDCEALKGIGYSEWRDYFLGASSIEEVRKSVLTDSLSLAKRQRTWFKRNKSIHWLQTPVKWNDFVELVTTFFEPERFNKN